MDNFEDIIITCKDCGNEFTFTVGEQKFFAEKGFSNQPQRCKECRMARKQTTKGEKKFFETVCAECGGVAKVPFEPTEGKRVLCSACFSKAKEEN